MRYNLMNILYEDNDLILYNPMSLNINNFQWPNGYLRHFITPQEIIKPYLICYKYYGNIVYTDLLLLLNKIEDHFKLLPGDEIRIPKLEDLNQFILDNKK